jgi:flagella basal body P-ring formation protein FlgA
MRFSFLLASFLVAGSMNRAGAQLSAQWQLLSDARVDSSGVFLDQLVQPVQPVALPRIRLALAPPLGQTVLLSRQQITAMLQTNVPALAATNWTGARQIRISRRTRQLAEPEWLDLLTGLLQRQEVKSPGQLELHLTLPWTPIAAPDEALTVKISQLPPGGLSPNCLAGIELWSGRERVGSWQLALHARVWRPIAVAHSPLIRGQLLRDADIVMQRSDVLLVRDALTDLSSADPSLELVENIPAGMPVLARSVRMRPLVRRGRVMEGIYREGNLVISLKVETLEDGLLGQTVRVRNPKTRRELYGKVENAQTILIAL